MKYVLALLLFAAPAFAQTPGDPPSPPVDPSVQALTSQLQGAGCNAALNAAAAEIIKLRAQLAQAQQRQAMKTAPVKK